MLTLLRTIVKLFKSLNSNSHPGEIAHAVCLGLLLGFMPKNNALWYLITAFCLFLRINKGAFALCILLFSLIAPALDGLFDKLGYAALMAEGAIPVYRSLLNIPFVAFTKFNNTIVMGTLLAALAAYIPVYALSRLSITGWRVTLAPKIADSKIFTAFKTLPIVSKIIEISQKIDEIT